MSDFSDLRKASTYEVGEWIRENFPISRDQYREIIEKGLIEKAPFQFFKQERKENSVWFRLTILFVPIVIILLLLFLPLNYIITGRWGYNMKKTFWLIRWLDRMFKT